MCFRPLPVRGGGEHSVIQTSRNNTVKGRRRKGRWAGRGHAFGGEGILKGKERVFVDHWTSWREGREMSVIEFEKGEKKDEEEGQKREERGAEH